MAQLPSAFACQAARPSCTTSPVRCTAKSMIVVVPPQAAARVPVSNVSDATVPPNGSSMCVCASTPPGTTYLPVASIVSSEVIDATGKYVVPGGIDAHTHMELPFGGTAASDTSRPAPGRRPGAAPPRSSTSPCSAPARWSGRASPPGTPRPRATAHVDYGFHMILGGVDDDSLKAMDQLVPTRASPASSCSWPTRASSTPTTARSCGRCRAARENGAMIMMHAENGIAIDVLVRAGARARRDRPDPPRLTRPGALEAEATHRAIQLAEVAPTPALHRPPVGQRGAGAGRGGPGRRPERLRRDLPAVPVPDPGGPARRARFRGRQVGLLDAAADQARAPPRRPVEGPADQRPRRRVDRPLPVLHEGPEGARASATSPRSPTGSAASSTGST